MTGTGCQDGGMSPDDRPVRPGRPRVVPNADSALSPRDQILDAAAALFVENGISATSTRAIAERVGIRQASLYYHFAGKDDMLVELLTTSVRPSLELVRGLEQLVPESASAAGALAALVVADVEPDVDGTRVVDPGESGDVAGLGDAGAVVFDGAAGQRDGGEGDGEEKGRAEHEPKLGPRPRRHIGGRGRPDGGVVLRPASVLR